MEKTKKKFPVPIWLIVSVSLMAYFWYVGHSRRMETPEIGCFSVFSGAYPELEDYVKERMNVPDSYKHISTTYSVVGDRIDIRMTFSGKNRFGGVVRSEARASCDKQCNLVGQPVILN